MMSGSEDTGYSVVGYRASKATDIQDLQNIIKEQNQLQKIHVTLD